MILGAGLGIIVLGILIWNNSRVSAQALVNDRFVPVPEVLQGNQNFAQVISNLEKHGGVPVQVNANELGRDNPFAK